MSASSLRIRRTLDHILGAPQYPPVLLASSLPVVLVASTTHHHKHQPAARATHRLASLRFLRRHMLKSLLAAVSRDRPRKTGGPRGRTDTPSPSTIIIYSSTTGGCSTAAEAKTKSPGPSLLGELKAVRGWRACENASLLFF